MAEALHSLQQQSLEDIEIIVVDDGSADSTAEVLVPRQQSDPRIYVIRQANAGVSAARNTGLRAARAAYIAFMDDDDLSAPQRLQNQFEMLHNQSEYSACTCAMEIIDERGTPCDKQIPAEQVARLFVDDTDAKPYFLNASMMIRRQHLLDIGGYRPWFQMMEDYDLSLRFHEYYHSCAIDTPLYLYRQYQSTEATRQLERGHQQLYNYKLAAILSAWMRHLQVADRIEQMSTDEIRAQIPSLPTQTRRIVQKQLGHLVRRRLRVGDLESDFDEILTMMSDSSKHMGWQTSKLRFNLLLQAIRYRAWNPAAAIFHSLLAP